jgi:hypothetical protein
MLGEPRNCRYKRIGLDGQGFQVLIMSEESRLGREQIETAYALKQITDAGAQVWFYLTCARYTAFGQE